MKKTLCQMALAIVAGIACAMVLMLVPSCSAPRPPAECEEIEVGMVRTPHGMYFILDEAGLAALNERTRRIQRGECRLPLD